MVYGKWCDETYDKIKGGFENLVEWDLKLHMVFGDKSQKEIQGL